MELVSGSLALLNLFGILGNVWLMRRTFSATRHSAAHTAPPSQLEQLRGELEVQIAERAVQLYRDLRSEYEQTTTRLNNKIAGLEAQRDEFEKLNHELRAEVDDLREHLHAMQAREQQYQDTCRRLDGEVLQQRGEMSRLKAENESLAGTVRSLQQEMDFYREVIKR